MPRPALPLALLCLLACAHGTGLSREEAQGRFSKLVSDYFDEAFAFEPTPGTAAYLGYGSSLETDRELNLSRLERVSDGFFVKLAYRVRP